MKIWTMDSVKEQESYAQNVRKHTHIHISLCWKKSVRKDTTWKTHCNEQSSWTPNNIFCFIVIHMLGTSNMYVERIFVTKGLLKKLQHPPPPTHADDMTGMLNYLCHILILS